MTLQVFDAVQDPQSLLNDQPLVCGLHPLHQYHGVLGSRMLLSTGRSSCYDPHNLAGYPKTPVFDTGSRPAELFMALSGGHHPFAAYKVGLAAMYILVPVLIAVAGWLMGLDCWSSVLASFVAVIVFWSGPGYQSLVDGELDILLGTLALLVHVGFLVRFDHFPGLFAWLGLIASAAVGWFVQPLLFLLVFLFLPVYYIRAGIHHRDIGWHLGLVFSEAIALAANALWLNDWLVHWWIRSPVTMFEGLLAHRTPRTVWEAPLWGTPVDRALAVVIVFSAIVGLVVLNQCKQKNTARLLALLGGSLFLAALLGILWKPFVYLQTSCLLMPSLICLALPAAAGWVFVLSRLSVFPRESVLGPFSGVVVLLAAVGGLLVFSPSEVRSWFQPAPLAIGLGSQNEQIVQSLITHTKGSARILWEDVPKTSCDERWPALLPLLTDRNFFGGLDPKGRIEHSRMGLVDGRWAGKRIEQWTDADLAAYCRKYNIRYVVAATSAVVQRLRQWKIGASEIGELAPSCDRYLFEIKASTGSFALHGDAEVVEINSERIALANIVPQDGKVVLSFHYQAGMRAVPSRVRVERETDPMDPIPLVRLCVHGPVSRLTLTWKQP